MKAITLCADDFALSLAGSARILELIDSRRLSATSVMVQSRHWPTLAPQLVARAEHADLGLHFNLTHPFDSHARPLRHWLLLSPLRQLSKVWLRQQFLQQIDLFSQHAQRLPDFIDGHQHVHAFRVIREALFEAINLRWPQHTQRPYLRTPDQLGHPGGALLKAGILQLACAGFAKYTEQQQLPYPTWFAGLYGLTPSSHFPALMRRWLHLAPSHALLMCHPGSADADDPIGPVREREYQYLISERFSRDCLTANVVLSRFNPTS